MQMLNVGIYIQPSHGTIRVVRVEYEIEREGDRNALGTSSFRTALQSMRIILLWPTFLSAL